MKKLGIIGAMSVEVETLKSKMQDVTVNLLFLNSSKQNSGEI